MWEIGRDFFSAQLEAFHIQPWAAALLCASHSGILLVRWWNNNAVDSSHGPHCAVLAPLIPDSFDIVTFLWAIFSFWFERYCVQCTMDRQMPSFSFCYCYLRVAQSNHLKTCGIRVRIRSQDRVFFSRERWRETRKFYFACELSSFIIFLKLNFRHTNSLQTANTKIADFQSVFD